MLVRQGDSPVCVGNPHFDPEKHYVGELPKQTLNPAGFDHPKVLINWVSSSSPMRATSSSAVGLPTSGPGNPEKTDHFSPRKMRD